jgi:hypothetical protein
VDEENVFPERTQMMAWIGPALTLACHEPRDYLVVLRDGQCISFHEARYTIGSQWITLLPEKGEFVERPAGVKNWPCPCGIDVRLSEIVFAVEEPYGY